MPEGPELHLAGVFVNQVCRGRIFTGKILKSEVSTRQVEVDWNSDSYTISALTRGKELKLTLTEVSDLKSNVTEKSRKSKSLLFQFGMSGKFDFYEATELKKHAHLNFFTKPLSKDDAPMVLSYVDYRRFGKWTPDVDWTEQRGPCIISEYEKFRENVLNNISDSAFNKPICEAMLNQKFFNGIGNYLRAEILYRLKIPPFVSARSALEPLANEGVKTETPDLLQLCNTVPCEVINLGATGYDPEGRDPDYSKFSEWLQCYYNPNMKNLADHNKRTMWFDGDPGPMVPTEKKTRKMKPMLKNKKKTQEKKTEVKEEIKSESKPTSIKSEKIPRSKGQKSASKSSAKKKVTTNTEVCGDRRVTRSDLRKIKGENSTTAQSNKHLANHSKQKAKPKEKKTVTNGKKRSVSQTACKVELSDTTVTRRAVSKRTLKEEQNEQAIACTESKQKKTKK